MRPQCTASERPAPCRDVLTKAQVDWVIVTNGKLWRL
jgi:hypothetical protein